ncbi:MAG: tRNA pseudouridine(55) synthase TruB, partial [Collinsella sp.]|nr:tRNA pseudouridine(55) synthase TruB [Collinsella sp.]
GVRSYKRARAGDEVELPSRPIEVVSADLIAIDGSVEGAPVWTVAFTVSKGTYIRALARDIGRAAGSAAHISALRRTASGSITMGSCVQVDGLTPELARESALDPARALGLSAVPIDADEHADVLLGRPLRDPRWADGSLSSRVALVHQGELVAIARREGDRAVMEHVFPQGIEGVRA